MKIILIATLISFALANTLYFRSPASLAAKEESGLSCVAGFFTGFFAHFNLGEPKQLLSCFDEKSNDLFFKHISAVSDLVQDAEARHQVQVHLDLIKLLAMHKALEPVHTCIVQTQDHQDILKALNIKPSSDEDFGLAKYIYYQANFGKLAEEVPQIVGALNNNKFNEAGDMAAGFVKSSVEEVQSQGLALLALDGLQNGVHIRLGLPDAESIVSCWNNETATIRLEFIYGLAVAVTNGDKKDALSNLETFYANGGSDLINKIPEDTWKCWGESKDVKSESEVLKIDITSDGFHQRGVNFIKAHPGIFWHLQKVIRSSLEHHNFNHAGDAYGHLMQATAASN